MIKPKRKFLFAADGFLTPSYTSFHFIILFLVSVLFIFVTEGTRFPFTIRMCIFPLKETQDSFNLLDFSKRNQYRKEDKDAHRVKALEATAWSNDSSA